jgi:tetratricopeptide (TPR) repeat protein
LGRFDHLEIADQNPEFDKSESNDSVMRDEDYYKAQADEAFACEDYERALAYYSRALQYNSSLEECWLGQLRCLIDLGELREALIWAKRALEKFPKSSQLLAATAIAEIRTGQPEIALGYSDGSLNEAGVTAYCWIARGEVLLYQTPVNSKACFNKAIELAPKEWSLRAAIGHAYRIRKMMPEAINYFQQAVRINPEQFMCWYWIGQCSVALKNYEQAVVAFRHTLAIRPNFVQAQDAINEIQKRGFFSRLSDAMRQTFKGN